MAGSRKGREKQEENTAGKEGVAGGGPGHGGSDRSVPMSLLHVRLTRSTTSVLALLAPLETWQSSFLEWSFQEKELLRVTCWLTPLVSSRTCPDTSDTWGS